MGRKGIPEVSLTVILTVVLVVAFLPYPAWTNSAPPTCAATAIDVGPPRTVKVTVQDADEGLATVFEDSLPRRGIEFAVEIPAFSQGTKDPVIVSLIRDTTDPIINTYATLHVVDVAGNLTTCEVNDYVAAGGAIVLKGSFGTNATPVKGTSTWFMLNPLAPVDSDGDGLEQAPAEIVGFDMAGTSTVLGPVAVRVRSVLKHPFVRSVGELEEVVNVQTGRLDVCPFAPAPAPGRGTLEAIGSFKLAIEVDVSGQTLHNPTPFLFQGVVTIEPGGHAERYLNPVKGIALVDESLNSSAISIHQFIHSPMTR